MARPLVDLPFDDTFDLIKKAKLSELFALAPEFATVNGYHAFDDQLPHVDRDAFVHETQFLRRWLRELQALPPHTLSADQRIDLQLFEHYMALHHFYFEDVRSWEKNPTAITEVGQLCFLGLLYNHDGADEVRFAQIAARLEQLPRYVREHQSRITTVPQRWRNLAVQTTQGMVLFFEVMHNAATLAAIPDTLKTRVGMATRQAQQETARYLEWMQQLPVDPAESWVFGPDRFARLLQLRKLGLEAREILALGEEYLARFREMRRALAMELTGSEDVDAARARVEADVPPDFAAALATTRTACAEAKAFLGTHHLVDIPDGEQLVVMETPPFLRPVIPFAAIFPPARFARPQQGNYIVTPPDTPQMLAKNLNYTNIYNTAVHEAYPGHHLQLATANLHCSLLRSSPFVGGKAIELVEGWAHYCEELMKERGFRNTVQDRFVMVNDLVWRAARVIIDVKLSSGDMSVAEGVAMLVAEAHLSEESAKAELNRYTHSPSYQLSYLIGKHQLMDLKRAVQQREGAHFNEANFHNRLLRAGSIPIRIIREQIFGV